MTSTIIGSPDSAGQPSDLIKDSSEATFVADVIEQSKTTPVLVDFWAPWCGPCKQLGPAIEKVVTGYGGKVKLVKINVDQNQAIAAQMRVQSIPAVFAFADGKPVDGFMGALPEAQIREFVDKILKNHGGGGNSDQLAEILKQAANLLDQGNTDEAIQLYSAILGQIPDNLAAIAGLARAQIAKGDLEAAELTLEKAKDSDDPDISSVKAALSLARTPVANEDTATLEERIAKNGDDFQARFDLALALNNAGDRTTAADQLLHIIEKNRNWNEEAARKQLLTFFEAWGMQDEATRQGRKKLSAILFS